MQDVCIHASTAGIIIITNSKNSVVALTQLCMVIPVAVVHEGLSVAGIAMRYRNVKY